MSILTDLVCQMFDIDESKNHSNFFTLEELKYVSPNNWYFYQD